MPKLRIFAWIIRQYMLNCTLLLDSAFRFGLGEGMNNSPVDARKQILSRVLCYCLS